MCDAGAIDLMCFAAAKRARVRPGMVQSIFARLERDADRAARLTADLLAAAFGWRVHTVARTMESLLSLGVTCDGVVTPAWRRVPEEPVSRAVGASAIRMRRLRERRKLDAEAGTTSPAVTCDTPATAALKEEKEDDHDLLLSETRASEAPSAFKRKEGWCQSVMRRAEAAGQLSASKSSELWAGIMMMQPDPRSPNWGLPRRTNDELDRLDQALRGPVTLAQPELLMPISGGAAREAPQTEAPRRLSANEILAMRDRRIGQSRGVA